MGHPLSYIKDNGLSLFLQNRIQEDYYIPKPKNITISADSLSKKANHRARREVLCDLKKLQQKAKYYILHKGVHQV